MIRRWLLLVLALLPGLSGATSLEELRAAGQLRARVLIETDPPHYQRAPLLLAVEVGTSRWFSGGTRVADFRVPGAVVLPASAFADNRSERIDGQTWTFQRWRFRLYAREPGALSLPPLRVSASVNHSSGDSVAGELVLETPTLDIRIPPGAPAENDWFAASDFRVEERWEGQTSSLRVGDALQRYRQFRIDDAPAMMLPERRLPGIPGLSLYPSPPDLRDRQDRGRLRGERDETLVVTFNAPGDYRIPGASWRWFDTTSGEWRLESLPDFEVTVGTASTTEVSAGRIHRVPERFKLIAGSAAMLLAILLWMGWRVLRDSAFWRQYQRRRDFLTALHQGDACAALARLQAAAIERHGDPLLSRRVTSDSMAADLLRRLLAAGYAPAAPRKSRPLFRAGEAKALWRAIHRPPEGSPAEEILALNPASVPRDRRSWHTRCLSPSPDLSRYRDDH